MSTHKVGDECTDGDGSWWRVVEVTPLGVVVLSDGWSLTTLARVANDHVKVTWRDGSVTDCSYKDGQG